MKKIKPTTVTTFLLLLFAVCSFPTSASAQCIDEQFTNATSNAINTGQSFTIPAGGCGTLTNLVIEIVNLAGTNPNAETATFELFVGETISGTPQYTQTGITISAGVGDKTITLGGGTGSLAVTAGAQYTWYLTLSDRVEFRLGASSNGGPYAGGSCFINGSLENIFDVDMIINSTAALPVDLTTFDAKKEASSVVLTWETASEENNEGFEIQRSTDGEQWETIDFVSGNGTIYEVSNYEYTDENPLGSGKDFELQNIYYRLKQIDFDGQFEYSYILNVEYQTSDSELQVFPNPVQTELNVVNGQGQVTIYNTLGQVIQTLNIQDSSAKINTSNLPKGQYILHIQKQNGIVQTQRFIK